MIFTEEDIVGTVWVPPPTKAENSLIALRGKYLLSHLLSHYQHLLRFLYPIIDYGLRRVMTEFAGKRQNMFGLDNLITKLLKKWMFKRTHGVAYRRLCVSLTSDAIGYSD